MSEQNVEIVRAAIAAYNRRDWGGVLRGAAPDFELDWSRAIGPYRGVYRLDQARSLLEMFNEAFESARFEPEEFIDDRETVVVGWTLHTVGRDGIEVSARGAWLWAFRDRVPVRLCLYQELGAALEAAGLAVD